MTFKLVREIPWVDLTPAAHGGSGASTLLILRGDKEARLPLLVEIWRAVACLAGNVWRGIARVTDRGRAGA